MEMYGIGPRVSLPCRYKDAATELSGSDLSGTGDEAYFNVPFKCNVVYAACIVTTVVSGAAVVKFDRRATVSSDTGRTDGTIATITLPDTTAAGVMVYDKAAQGSLTAAAAALLVTEATCQAGGGYWDSANSVCKNHPYGELQPGEEVVVQIISGTTGKFTPILVVDMADEVMGNLDNVLETA
jgi:hypothetical protein